MSERQARATLQAGRFRRLFSRRRRWREGVRGVGGRSDGEASDGFMTQTRSGGGLGGVLVFI